MTEKLYKVATTTSHSLKKFYNDQPPKAFSFCLHGLDVAFQLV